MSGTDRVVDISREVVAEIRRLVRRQLASAGMRVSDIVVRPGEDHDGDPAIMVQIRHRPGERPFDARAAAQASFALNSMLHHRGERRFAFVKHDEDGAR